MTLFSAAVLVYRPGTSPGPAGRRPVRGVQVFWQSQNLGAGQLCLPAQIRSRGPCKSTAFVGFPGGLIFRDDFKFRHGSRPSTQQTDFQSRPSYHTCHLFATFVRFFVKGTLPEKRKRKGQNGKGAWGKTSGLHRCGIAVPGPSGQRGDESPLYPSLLPLYTSSPLSAMDTKS